MLKVAKSEPQCLQNPSKSFLIWEESQDSQSRCCQLRSDTWKGDSTKHELAASLFHTQELSACCQWSSLPLSDTIPPHAASEHIPASFSPLALQVVPFPLQASPVPADLSYYSNMLSPTEESTNIPPLTPNSSTQQSSPATYSPPAKWRPRRAAEPAVRMRIGTRALPPPRPLRGGGKRGETTERALGCWPRVAPSWLRKRRLMGPLCFTLEGVLWF